MGELITCSSGSTALYRTVTHRHRIIVPEFTIFVKLLSTSSPSPGDAERSLVPSQKFPLLGVVTTITTTTISASAAAIITISLVPALANSSNDISVTTIL